LVPWLHLQSVRNGDVPNAHSVLLGPIAPGLSANTVTRLKAGWEEEYRAQSQRSLKDKQYVYVWADSVHLNIRLEGGRIRRSSCSWRRTRPSSPRRRSASSKIKMCC
jgi:putative transposase